MNARALPEHASMLPLWPDLPPGTPAGFGPPRITDLSDNPFFPDRELTRISRPSLTVLHPERANGTAVIVAPGGGYSRISIEQEGRSTARWLLSLGVTVFLMTYRLPDEGHANGADVPLQDAQRAVRLVRSAAPDWGLDPARIGVLGASAAGRMMASLITGFDRPVYPPTDAADRASARPDFAILLYPVISMEAGIAHPGSRDRLIGEAPSESAIKRYSPDQNLRSDTPETFIVQADDDEAVPAENALRFYLALRQASVRAELHVFREGGHGFGIEKTAGLPLAAWPDLCAAWMARLGALPD